MKTFKEFNNINESKINEDSNGIQGVKEYRDGLTPEIIQKEFPWLLKAKFKDAKFGYENRFSKSIDLEKWNLGER